MAGDDAEAMLGLYLKTREMPQWEASRVEMSFETIVKNQGEIELTDVTPGSYDFLRQKWVGIEDTSRGFGCDRRTVVVGPGETQFVDLIRTGAGGRICRFWFLD
jgi:hypothetical protein